MNENIDITFKTFFVRLMFQEGRMPRDQVWDLRKLKFSKKGITTPSHDLSTTFSEAIPLRVPVPSPNVGNVSGSNSSRKCPHGHVLHLEPFSCHEQRISCSFLILQELWGVPLFQGGFPNFAACQDMASLLPQQVIVVAENLLGRGCFYHNPVCFSKRLVHKWAEEPD